MRYAFMESVVFWMTLSGVVIFLFGLCMTMLSKGYGNGSSMMTKPLGLIGAGMFSCGLILGHNWGILW